jgi:signal transduction histidine kinase
VRSTGKRRWSARHPLVATGLRTRATIGFGVVGFVVALAAAAVTFSAARGYLIDQRQSTAMHQAFVNARLARSVLRAERPDVRSFLASLGGSTSSESVLRFRGESFSTSVGTGPDAVPDEVIRLVSEGSAARQRSSNGEGDLRFAVGVPIPSVDAEYYELFSLGELTKTLDLLVRALGVGVLGAAIVAASIGRAAANRLVRPLGPMADAAERIAGGALDTRIDVPADRDLRRFTEAFNSMAEALELRVDREARFAADVSHELRSPLTAVMAAMEIIERRREQLPAQVVEAFTVLSDKVDLFRQMVLDLLEISRVDAGTAELTDDLIDVQHLLRRVADLHGAGAVPVEIDAAVPSHIQGDRRRLVQALGNIIDNAARYAGGITGICASVPRPGWVRIAIDDGGPGIAPEERDAVFGRFARGAAGVAAGAGSGSGLGLALVA